MKLKAPNPIYLQGGEHAVLLLHSFTGTSNEMKQLATYLHGQGFTCYAITYAGHGQIPEAFYETSLQEMFESSVSAFQFLQMQGYEQISIIGQSLGGVFALNIAEQYPVEKVITISSPVLSRPLDELESRVYAYTKYMLKLQQFSKEKMDGFVEQNFPRPKEKLIALQSFIVNTRDKLKRINTDVLAIAGGRDDLVYQQSAKIILDEIDAPTKQLLVVEQGKHLLTIEKNVEFLFKNIVSFVK